MTHVGAPRGLGDPATDYILSEMDPAAPCQPLSEHTRRPWWRPLLHAGVVVLLGGGLLLAVVLPGNGSESPSRSAPLFDLANIRPGEPNVSLAALRRQRVVVNFWASWCVPCRKELPAIKRVAASVRGVRFVGVDVKDGQSSARDFAEKFGVRYPSGWDPDGAVAAAYGARGLPTTAFIDRNGRLLETHLGELTESKLRSIIRRRFPEVRQ